MTISTKDYNNILATVYSDMPVEKSGVAPGPERDALYERLLAAKNAGKVYWPIND